jgi:hypothetical protein
LVDGVHRNGANRKGTHSRPAGEERKQALFQPTAIFGLDALKNWQRMPLLSGRACMSESCQAFSKKLQKVPQGFSGPSVK